MSTIFDALLYSSSSAKKNTVVKVYKNYKADNFYMDQSFVEIFLDTAVL